MKSLIWVLVAVVIVGGAWYLFSRNTGSVPAPAEVSNTQSTTTVPAATVPTITYTDSGFSPASLTVPVGTTVTFVNNASDQMMVASNPHPTHQGYDGTTRAQHCVAGYTGPAPLDECTAASPGSSWTFTFTKAGTWGFHNHASPGDSGTVIVQ